MPLSNENFYFALNDAVNRVVLIELDIESPMLSAKCSTTCTHYSGTT